MGTVPVQLGETLMTLDISNLFDDDGQPPPDDRPVDDSGKPVPENVVAILDSGVRVPCTVRFDGIEQAFSKLWRRYLVVAEVDWQKHRIDILEIGAMPTDVTIQVQVWDMPDHEWMEYAEHMQARVVKEVQV